ncbi:MAG TPA: flagellar assembly protein FliW [Campylobacterales bacterium]|nr:flagellar assembly protein FliW [Campylobacterales bacterium]
MKVSVISPIFGFDDIKDMELEEVDEFFYLLKAGDISFTLINPATVREYELVIPKNYQNILQVEDESDIKVFNIVTILNPIEKSTINFLAPIVINMRKQLLVQVPLDEQKYKEFGLNESIEKYL